MGVHSDLFIAGIIKQAVAGSVTDPYLALRQELGDISGISGMPSLTVDTSATRPSKSGLKKYTSGDVLKLDKDDPAKVSQLFSRVYTDYKSPYSGLHSVAGALPVFSDISNIFKTMSANNHSWDAINKVYGDDKDIIRMFGNLRNQVLVPEMKYNIAKTIPKALLGALMAHKGYKWGSKIFDKNKNPILHRLAKYSLGGLGLVTGSGLGSVFNILTRIPDYYKHQADEARNSASYRNMSNALNAKLLQHVNNRTS